MLSAANVAKKNLRTTTSRWGIGLLLLIAAVIFYTNLGVPGLWDEDEPRNAACAAEMLARNDWVVPTFNGNYRTQKPVMLYWLQMLSYQVWGMNEFAARFPSATLSLGTVLLVRLLGCKLHSRATGWLAALMAATALMFVVAARASTPDGCLIIGVTWTLTMYVRGCSSTEPGSFGQRGVIPSMGWLTLVYAGMGWSMLAKGPVGIGLPSAIIGIFVLLAETSESARLGMTSESTWYQRGWRQVKLMLMQFPSAFWRLCPWLAAVVILAIAAPWYIAVHLKTDGVWTRTFFFYENLQRFQEPMENHHGPVYYYILAMLIGFFPWSIFAPVAIYRSTQRVTHESSSGLASGFLLTWLAIWVGLFSLAQTKLPSYVLPAYPALAIVTAILVVDWLRQPTLITKQLMYCAWGTLVVVGLVLSIALPWYLTRFIPFDPWLCGLGLVPFVGGSVACFCYYREQHRMALQAVMVTSVLFALAFFAGATVRVSQYQNSAHLIAEIRQLSSEYVQTEPSIATFCYSESSVIYYARQPVLTTDDAAVIQQLFLDREQAFVITTAKDYVEKLQGKLPLDVQILHQERRFMKANEQTILLGRQPRIASQFPRLQR